MESLKPVSEVNGSSNLKYDPAILLLNQQTQIMEADMHLMKNAIEDIVNKAATKGEIETLIEDEFIRWGNTYKSSGHI